MRVSVCAMIRTSPEAELPIRPDRVMDADGRGMDLILFQRRLFGEHRLESLPLPARIVVCRHKR